MDEQDYAVFLHLLKYYLSPIDEDNNHPSINFNNYFVIRPRQLKNMEKEIDLIAFCLMPNHFHLLLQQHNIDSVSQMLLKVSTTYAMYFNKRYKRVGYLFQGPYRAVNVDNDQYLLHLSRYIHLNPMTLTGAPLVSPAEYPFSSYKYFLGEKHASWVKPKIILDYFDKGRLLPFLQHYPSYKEFVEGSSGDSKEIIGNLALE